MIIILTIIFVFALGTQIKLLFSSRKHFRAKNVFFVATKLKIYCHEKTEWLSEEKLHSVLTILLWLQFPVHQLKKKCRGTVGLYARKIKIFILKGN